ncbi:hypothetical protein [Streptomyces klenkii]
MRQASSLFPQSTITREKVGERLFGVGSRAFVLEQGEVAIGVGRAAVATTTRTQDR